jgi:hypothetical protein
MVQGEGRQDKFQARPDILLWNITDWSGGEGQVVFNAQAHNRHALLHNVEPFERPGTLMPGYYIEDSKETGPTTLTVDPILVKFSTAASGGVSELIVLDANIKGDWWAWNPATDLWVQQTDYTGPTGKPQHACADEGYVYIDESSATKVWKFARAGGAATAMVTSGVVAPSDYTDLVELGNYVYHINWAGFTVVEILKSTPTAVTVDSDQAGTHMVNTPIRNLVAKGPNRLYIAVPYASGDTAIREITPSSAAGTGFGTEIARYPNLTVTALWYHQGTIFVGGVMSSYNGTERVLLYHIPGGDYGAIGTPRPPLEESYTALIQGSNAANRLQDTVFVTSDAGLAGSGSPRVFALDVVGGGYAQIASVTDAGSDCTPPVLHQGDVFFGKDSGSGSGGVFRMDRSKYDNAGYAITPWHDMGLSDEKILSSVVLSCEALPAGWTITISYAVNGSSSFTSAGAYSTTSGTGTRFAISTDSTTKKFRNVRIKVAFSYSGTPTTRPVVHGVEVRAQVAKPVPVWKLLLDLNDDHSGGSQSYAGSVKFTNIKTAGDLESVVDFKDGYPDRRAGTYTSYDVIVDQYDLVLDRPGEGVAQVALRQVV